MEKERPQAWDTGCQRRRTQVEAAERQNFAAPKLERSFGLVRRAKRRPCAWLNGADNHMDETGHRAVASRRPIISDARLATVIRRLRRAETKSPNSIARSD